MSKLSNLFGHRLDWRFRPGYSLVKSSPESEQEASGTRSVAEPDKRETSDENKSDYKRVEKKFKCPTEPFFETLRILDELL